MVLKCDLFAIESVLYMDIRTTRNCTSREFKLKPLSTWVDQVCGVKNGILRSDWDYSKVLDFILWPPAGVVISIHKPLILNLLSGTERFYFPDRESQLTQKLIHQVYAPESRKDVKLLLNCYDNMPCRI